MSSENAELIAERVLKGYGHSDSSVCRNKKIPEKKSTIKLNKVTTGTNGYKLFVYFSSCKLIFLNQRHRGARRRLCRAEVPRFPVGSGPALGADVVVSGLATADQTPWLQGPFLVLYCWEGNDEKGIFRSLLLIGWR